MSSGRGWHPYTAPSLPVDSQPTARLAPQPKFSVFFSQTFPANWSTKAPAYCVGTCKGTPPPGFSHPPESGPHGVDGTDRAVGSRRHELRTREGGWPLPPHAARRLGQGLCAHGLSPLEPQVQPVKKVKASAKPAELTSLSEACRGVGLDPAAPR